MSFLEKKYNTSKYSSINYSLYENPELRIRKMEKGGSQNTRVISQNETVDIAKYDYTRYEKSYYGA